MNVLMVYPQLPLSFWSVRKILKMRGKRGVQPPLSLLTLAALLPREWKIRLIDMNVRPVSEDDWQWAEVVMVSGMFSQKAGFMDVLAEAKRRQKKTVAGGAYPTLLPEEIFGAGCDYVVKGEAEGAIPQLAETLVSGKGPRTIEAASKPDLAASPVPRFDLVQHQEYQIMSIQTSRGCPHNCEFCDIVEMFGRNPRSKTPGQIAGELDALRATGYAGQVFVCDDNFIGNRKAVKDILERMIAWNDVNGSPFSYITQVSMNLGNDLELIDLMTAANFGDVLIGLETPDSRVLDDIGKTQNTRVPMIDAVNNIKKNGLTVMASFIIGFDNEDRDVAERICSLVEQTDIPVVVPNMLLAIPRTRLWRRLEKEGRLMDVGDLPEITLTRINFKTVRPQAEIVADYRTIWNRLYEPSRYLARAYRYYTAMRPTRRTMAAARGETVPSRRKTASRLPKNMLHDLWVFLQLVWSLGIVSECRGQFWRQILDLRKSNPSRLRLYVDKCAHGLWLEEIRGIYTKKADVMIAELRAGAGSSTSAGPRPTAV